MRNGKETIKTQSVYDEDQLPSDGIRILVTRFHPRKKGFKKGIGYDIWLRALAPREELLASLKNETITVKKFSQLYFRQLREKNMKTIEVAEKDKALRVLKEYFDMGTTVTLLCYEPEDGITFCHRHVLKAFLLANMK